MTSTISLPGVDADFDFCQTTIKQIFRDVDLCQELKQDHNCYLRYELKICLWPLKIIFSKAFISLSLSLCIYNIAFRVFDGHIHVNMIIFLKS